jgi:hypothetical protein
VIDGINTGEMQVIISPVTGARNYMYEYMMDPLSARSDWEGQNSTLSKLFLKTWKAVKNTGAA